MEPSEVSSPSQDPSFFEGSRKRFQKQGLSHVPVIILDREGTIRSMTGAARQLLEYPSDACMDDCFFSYVHKRNMRRVMRDLAHMVCRGKQRAQWLLRLRTGNQRWRWYRATVQNNLGRQEDHILIRLRPQ